MEIKRKRYIITRNNHTEIFCGLARDYKFKNINDIGDTAIKTYASESKARASFKNSWRYPDFEIEILEMEENYKSI